MNTLLPHWTPRRVGNASHPPIPSFVLKEWRTDGRTRACRTHPFNNTWCDFGFLQSPSKSRAKQGNTSIKYLRSGRKFTQRWISLFRVRKQHPHTPTSPRKRQRPKFRRWLRPQTPGWRPLSPSLLLFLVTHLAPRYSILTPRRCLKSSDHPDSTFKPVFDTFWTPLKKQLKHVQFSDFWLADPVTASETYRSPTNTFNKTTFGNPNI